jgi:uncharacterized membrane protein
MKLQVKRELFRSIPLAIVGLGILIPDSSSSVVLFAVGISIVLVLVSHVLRKLLFPYLDMEELVNKAKETPAGAAMVFIAICWVLGVLIQSSVSLLR